MSITITIKTNHHWHELLTWHDIPESERADFDYIDSEERFSPRMFCYRGRWYDTNEFFVIPQSLPAELREWSGYQSDSYFSGVVVRYSDDFEQVQVGTYYS